MRYALPLLCLACASSSFAADRTYGDWVVSSGQGLYEAYTANQSGSSLGVLCSDSVCRFYVVSGITCEAGKTYVALINSELGASSNQLSCITLPLSGKNENVLFLGDIESFASTVYNAPTLGIAIPMASGEFRVSRFSLRGSAKALEQVLKLRSAGSSNPASGQGIRDTTL